MNIKEAKEQIKNAMAAYFTLDDYSNFEIPIEKQRPVFLMGPPGIGKTAIMEQIAQELGVGLVSYSMTHHTRQSALGLPFIVRKTYGGREYDVSEYTMSEIIASVYDMMEQSGIKKGILFLDEINCVSETLAPVMLQFLQFKIFGRHRVPDGWIVVTAGNPPEYNKSVREFDIVTWDRLKRVDVEPDFEVWKEYAYRKSIHAAIMTYLEIKKGDFYKVETTVDGKRFVTARGWDDLSQMIRLYEKHGFKVDHLLVEQYVQDEKIARDFAIYYDLYNKYRSDYKVDAILDGKAEPEIKTRAKAAGFDERLSLLGLLLDSISAGMRFVIEQEQMQQIEMEILKVALAQMSQPGSTPAVILEKHVQILRAKLEKGRQFNSISVEEQRLDHQVIANLERLHRLLRENSDGMDGQAAAKLVQTDFERQVSQIGEKDAIKTGKHLTHMFNFCEEVFGEGQELLILVTELTLNFYSAHFISRFRNVDYFKHNRELMFYERQKGLILEIEKLAQK